MLPVFKLIQCKDCLNTKNNKITPCLNKSYKSLHEVQCVSCNNIWLMCALHGIRFKHRRYFLAKEHVRTVYHPPDTSTLKILTNTSFCQLTSDNIGVSNQNSNVLYDCDDAIDNSSFNSGSDNFGHSITTDSMSNSTIIEFKDGQKPVMVDDYNINMRRYIKSESTMMF